MHITISKTVSEQVCLTDTQVKQIAITAILRKLCLSDSARLSNGAIYDDSDRVENLFIRTATPDDLAAFATIEILKK